MSVHLNQNKLFKEWCSPSETTLLASPHRPIKDRCNCSSSMVCGAHCKKHLLEKDNFHCLGHFKNVTSTEMNLHMLNPLCCSCPKECDDTRANSRRSFLPTDPPSSKTKILIANHLFKDLRR